MKKYYVLMVALSIVSGAMGQWFPQNSGTSKNLNSVYFTDANTGYAVGDSGIILRTIDGGDNWEIKSSGTYADLFSVQFTDSLTGYAVGDSSIILKTVDGGEDWLNQPAGVSADFSSVSFPAEDTGYVIGFYFDWLNSDTLYNYILKTTDGGNLWTISYLYKTIDDAGAPRVMSVFSPDVNTGYAVGVYGNTMFSPYIIKTTNGGIDWTTQYWSVSNTSLNSAYFLNPDTGYLVGYGEINLFKTLNGGTDWINQSSSIGWCNSVFFTDAINGYIVGVDWQFVGSILHTDNGGDNWTTQYTDNTSGSSFLSVNFANDTTGYVVGTNGIILKTTNGGVPVGINDKPLTIELIKIFPNPASTAITISTPTTPEKNIILTIFNINGQVIQQRQITEPQTMVDVTGLSSGLYFLKVLSDDGVQVGKFVKE